jgi:hypothetical protein
MGECLRNRGIGKENKNERAGPVSNPMKQTTSIDAMNLLFLVLGALIAAALLIAFPVNRYAVRTGVEEFESVEELESWLGRQVYYCPPGDCDDRARALAQQAIAEGYEMYCQYQYHHMVCWCPIGNQVYRIDPEGVNVWFNLD